MINEIGLRIGYCLIFLVAFISLSIGCVLFVVNLLLTSTGWQLIISYFLVKYMWKLVVVLDREYKLRYGVNAW